MRLSFGHVADNVTRAGGFALLGPDGRTWACRWHEATEYPTGPIGFEARCGGAAHRGTHDPRDGSFEVPEIWGGVPLGLSDVIAIDA